MLACNVLLISPDPRALKAMVRMLDHERDGVAVCVEVAALGQAPRVVSTVAGRVG